MKGVVMLLCCCVGVMVMVMVGVAPQMTEGRDAPSRRSRMTIKQLFLWRRWKLTYGKWYRPGEELKRRRAFLENVRTAANHNAQYPVAVSYTQGLNKFSDMTVEEFVFYNHIIPANRSSKHCISVDYSSPHTLPDTVDWRTKGYVTPVHDQGLCRSGWAFSATGSVEGQYFNKTGRLLKLSEQQLVDCSRSNGNMGCHGGNVDNSYSYILNLTTGLATDNDYPYHDRDLRCRFKPPEGKVTLRACVRLPEGHEDSLKHAVALVGPVAVAVDASPPSFKSYKGGVYYDPRCLSTRYFRNHGMLAVGYGTYQGQDYWLLKNSWGSDWGMNGYMMLARNRDNHCGVATLATYPIV